MRLRTLTGLRFPAKCADGCGARIEPGPDVKVVVDFESKPRKTWLPEHSPDAGTWNRGRGGAGPSGDPDNPPPQTSRPGYPKPRQVLSPAPPSPPSPSPPPAGDPTTPHVSVEVEETQGDAPSGPTLGKPWAGGQLSLRESSQGFVRVTFSSHAQEGEEDRELRARVNAALLQDLEAQVLGLRSLRTRLGIEMAAPTARRTKEGT